VDAVSWVAGLILVIVGSVKNRLPKQQQQKQVKIAPSPLINVAPTHPMQVVTPEKAKTLEKLIRVSTRVKIDDMAGVLDVPRNELLRKMLDLSDQFNFKIEGEEVNFGSGNTEDFIAALDKEFAEWGKKGKV